MAEFGCRIGKLRRDIERRLRRPGLPRDKVVALAIEVLDRTLIRIGNRRHAAENDAYGLTTLTCDHVAVDGLHVHLDFTGKGGADYEIVFDGNQAPPEFPVVRLSIRYTRGSGAKRTATASSQWSEQ